jgi:hypothetical protein
LSNYQKWTSDVVEPFFKVCAQAWQAIRNYTATSVCFFSHT